MLDERSPQFATNGFLGYVGGGDFSGFAGSGPYNSPLGRLTDRGFGAAIAHPQGVTSPLYRFRGRTAGAPTPDIWWWLVGPQIVASRRGGVHMGRCAVPRTPTSPLYRLRARSTGSGTCCWGPNPRHMVGVWGVAPRGAGAGPYSGGPNPRHIKGLLGAAASPPGAWFKTSKKGQNAEPAELNVGLSKP
eukprot:gene22404-biopygen1166